jgi:hypothetical protein
LLQHFPSLVLRHTSRFHSHSETNALAFGQYFHSNRL